MMSNFSLTVQARNNSLTEFMVVKTGLGLDIRIHPVLKQGSNQLLNQMWPVSPCCGKSFNTPQGKDVHCSECYRVEPRLNNRLLSTGIHGAEPLSDHAVIAFWLDGYCKSTFTSQLYATSIVEGIDELFLAVESWQLKLKFHERYNREKISELFIAEWNNVTWEPGVSIDSYPIIARAEVQK